MSAAPFMQLYVADYLGDTRHLTTEQHGAYLLLLMTMWRADGRLPNDPKKLARITGCTASRWARIAAEVMEFFEVDGGDITNARLKLELEKASEKSIKRAEAGSLGGKAKALKNNDPPVANAVPLPKHSPEPNIREEEEGYISGARDEPAGGLFAEAPKVTKAGAVVEATFEAWWAIYPRKVSKGAARVSYTVAVKKIGAGAAKILIDGASRLAEEFSNDADKTFIPHPATWLNQDGWNDEPGARRPKGGGVASRPTNGGGGGSGVADFASIRARRRREAGNPVDVSGGGEALQGSFRVLDPEW